MAKWRIVLEGDMPFPIGRIEAISQVDQVPVVVVTVPPGIGSAAVDDDRPFLWPPFPGPLNTGPEMRYAWAWTSPHTGHVYYVQAPEFGNPGPASYRYAGMTAHNPRSPVPEGHRLWAPELGSPRIIRAILRGDDPDTIG